MRTDEREHHIHELIRIESAAAELPFRYPVIGRPRDCGIDRSLAGR